MTRSTLASIGFAWCALATVALLTPAWSRASDGGAVEGAIWRYEMTRVAGRKMSRQGRFRVHGTEIFQPPMGEDAIVVGTIEGKFDPPKDRAKVTFNKLRGSDSTEMSCQGRLQRTEAGLAVGELIDADGFHWKFKAQRVRE